MSDDRLKKTHIIVKYNRSSQNLKYISCNDFIVTLIHDLHDKVILVNNIPKAMRVNNTQM